MQGRTRGSAPTETGVGEPQPRSALDRLPPQRLARLSEFSALLLGEVLDAADLVDAVEEFVDALLQAAAVLLLLAARVGGAALAALLGAREAGGLGEAVLAGRADGRGDPRRLRLELRR